MLRDEHTARIFDNSVHEKEVDDLCPCKILFHWSNQRGWDRLGMGHAGKRSNYILVLMRKTWSKGTAGKFGPCQRVGWGGGTNYQVLEVWQGNQGAQLCYICFCIYWWYHYLPIVQINPFRPGPIHSATDSLSFQFRAKILSWSALAGVEHKNIFHGGLWPKPAVGGPGLRHEWEDIIKMYIQEKG